MSDPVLDVTGGAMYEMGGRIHLVFGQDFQGGYVSGKNGIYSKQIRSFDINDDGASLSISNISITPETEAYRRRDLNVFPVIRNNELDEGLVVLSGVFTGNFGVWSVLVEIDANGLPTMADPAAPKTFKQAMNNYHSAKLGLYSEAREEMHELLFGGITLQYYDEESQQFLTDNTVVGHIFFGGGSLPMRLTSATVLQPSRTHLIVCLKWFWSKSPNHPVLCFLQLCSR